MSTVAVVVPTRNNLDQLARCIHTLLSQEHAPARIFVCIDGSTDGTLEYVETIAPSLPTTIKALIHPGNEHRGRAATRNLALDHLHDEFVWFVDSDMTVAPDALARHLDLVTTRSCMSIGAVNYLNADQTLWAGYLNTRGRHRREDGEVMPFTQFTTQNALVHAAAFRALRGFDERFTGYGGEDLELAFRLQESTGEPLVNNKAAVATTIEDKTVSEALQQFESYGATNIHLMERLHPSMPRTFELQRMGSRRLRDRAFVAAMNPITDRSAGAVVRFGPRPAQFLALNYLVIRAIWRGYVAGLAG